MTSFPVKLAFGSVVLMASTLASAQAQRDVRATHCEIFVDKVRIRTSSHALRAAELFLKVRPEALDGTVTKAGFFGTRATSTRTSPNPATKGPYELLASSFLGTGDYFVLTDENSDMGLLLGSEYHENVWKGSFFVETSAGTRYWANNAEGGDFRIDYDAVRNAYRSQQAHPNSIPEFRDVGALASTADIEPGLNPQRCR